MDKNVLHNRWLSASKVKIVKMWETLKLSQSFMDHHVLIFKDAQHTYGEGHGTPLQYSCLENPMDRGAWWAAIHGIAKSPIQLSDFTFTFHFHALEKEMGTHSSVLAWRIPGTGEPDGLPTMGLQRVRDDWSDLATAAALKEGEKSSLFLP